VPVSVAGDGHRVDRVDLPAGGAQARDEQAAAGFDRDRDRRLGAVTGVGEQLQQQRESVRVVADTSLGDQLAVGVDERHVVMVFGPIDTAEHCQALDPPFFVGVVALVASRARTHSSLMAGREAQHPTSRS
jgi:hypothetical protein